MKKTALVDVDQVLADTWRVLAEIAAPNLDWRQLKTWGLVEEMQPEERKKAKELMADVDFWLKLPVVEGAQEGLRTLRSANFHVVALTAPWIRCKGWEWARRKFLSQHGIRIATEDVIVTKLKHLVRGHMLFEDKAENINNWAAENPECVPVLFDYSYNRVPTHASVVRIEGWRELDKVLKVHNERHTQKRLLRPADGRSTHAI